MTWVGEGRLNNICPEAPNALHQSPGTPFSSQPRINFGGLGVALTTEVKAAKPQLARVNEDQVTDMFLSLAA